MRLAAPWSISRLLTYRCFTIRKIVHSFLFEHFGRQQLCKIGSQPVIPSRFGPRLQKAKLTAGPSDLGHPELSKEAGRALFVMQVMLMSVDKVDKGCVWVEGSVTLANDTHTPTSPVGA